MANENTNIIFQKLQAAASLRKEAIASIKELISQFVASVDRVSADYVKTANKVIDILTKELDNSKLSKKEREKIRKKIISILKKVEKETENHRRFIKEVIMSIIFVTLSALAVYAAGRNSTNQGELR